MASTNTSSTEIKCAPSNNLNVGYPQFPTAKELHASLVELTSVRFAFCAYIICISTSKCIECLLNESINRWVINDVPSYSVYEQDFFHFSAENLLLIYFLEYYNFFSRPVEGANSLYGTLSVSFRTFPSQPQRSKQISFPRALSTTIRPKIWAGNTLKKTTINGNWPNGVVHRVIIVMV